MNKIIRRCIYVIIIIILILSIALIVIKSNQKNNNTQTEEPKQEEVIETLDEDSIIPQNSYLFFGKYVKGEVEAKEIYDTINVFTKSIMPKYYNNLKDASKEDIYKYYEINSTYIAKYMQIHSKEEFEQFVKQLQKLKTSKLELQSLEFVEGEISYTNLSTSAKIKVKYKDNDEIEINVKVFKKIQEQNRNVVFY